MNMAGGPERLSAGEPQQGRGCASPARSKAKQGTEGDSSVAPLRQFFDIVISVVQCDSPGRNGKLNGGNMSSLKKVASKVTEHVVLPQLGRMGNLSTGTLIGMGVSAQHADWLMTGLIGAVLVGLDLLASAFGRWSKARE